MAKFEISCGKGSSGEIRVYGNYKAGTEPVFVERVIIEELDNKGNTIGYFAYHVHRSLDPVQGNYFLVGKMPSGKNVKAARAVAHYIEIEETATSELLKL
jgi:hypothetical protein